MLDLLLLIAFIALPIGAWLASASLTWVTTRLIFAFGVAGAYPAQSRDWQAADIGSFFMLVLFLASLLPCQAMDRVRARAQPAKFRACYRPGCPPPAMAPPHASH